MAAVSGAAASHAERADYRIPFVIAASSVGTIIEWYDFYLYAVLTVFLAPLFFPNENPTASILAGFATFGAGFAVRPFGSVVFGYIGDKLGRKYAFLITVAIMGLGTMIIGLLPTYAQIGVFAPTLLVLLRLLQGLAIGGEYGGAAIYVGEHAPDSRRGYLTSWINTTATVGLVLALLVILLCRLAFGTDTFAAWGWRVPFILSVVLVGAALYIRARLRETPLFAMLKAEGRNSERPLADSLGSGRNWKLILLALFGATAGQAVVWYQAQFQARTFMESQMAKPPDFIASYSVFIVALLLGTPLFVVFGGLSDRVGRKPIILGGCLLAAITFYPIYLLMAHFANPFNWVAEVVLVFIQMVYAAMVYGPMAAFLIEFFPAKIRYTSLSLPYHLGNGEFGGWLPFIAVAITAATGNVYAALIYPIGVALLTVVIGSLFVRETRLVRIWDEVGGAPATVEQASAPVTGRRPVGESEAVSG
jgi:MFS family permease